ncbi:hypothetical protein HN799_00050 [Candidatus Woesearchaeota archaeon]|jgi:hypothetical protein|nr:hypothetical protein [Candidatus Woesearchaeota archaeon]MBT7331654.1 hypothetical protein [Candidatus Woesearchaeota archaeon]
MIATNKRGQAAAAAVFIAILLGLIIMYIVIIPPSERAELLGEETTTTTSDGTTITSSGADVLLISKPGKIDYLAQDTIEHPLSSINIFTKTEDKILDEKDSLITKTGLFSKKSANMTFFISDLKNTENHILNFNIKEADGTLYINLNGQEVFAKELSSGQNPVIKLPTSALKEGNFLEFVVSSPGAAFWSTNEYALENIKVVASVTSISAQNSKSTFLISETEKNNLKTVVLEFYPECIEKTGKLTAWVNNKEIYSGLPSCGAEKIELEVAPELINQGENSLAFKVDEGEYTISPVAIISELEEIEFPTFYFELTNEQYNEIQDEDNTVKLALSFVDIVDINKGDLVINGETVPFEISDASHKIDISNKIVQGSNSIKIRPKKTLEVRELKVTLE